MLCKKLPFHYRDTTLPTLPNHVSDRCPLPPSPTNGGSSVIRNASVVIACPSLSRSVGRTIKGGHKVRNSGGGTDGRTDGHAAACG